MSDRGFKGIWIPSAVWLSEDLSLLEKCFFAEIDSLDNGDRGCTASNGYLSGFFGLSKEYVSKQISKLEKRGLIECTYDKETNRTIRVTQNGRLFLAGLPISEYERKPADKPEDGQEQGLNDWTRGGCPNGQGGVVQMDKGGVVQMDKHITKEDNKENNKGEREAQAPAPKRTRSIFVPPTAEEAEAYFLEIEAPGEGEAFANYHTSRGWIVGNSGMKDWKAAARTWKANAKRFGAAAGTGTAGAGSAGSAGRGASSVNAAAAIREVEAALNSREYFVQTGYSAAEGRQVVKAKNLPAWSDPAIGAAVDSAGGFFKLRERVTQGTVPESIWKGQIERYYRQEKEAAFQSGT